MPIVTRRYQFVGPTNADLTKFASSTASVAATFQGPIIDITIDNSQPGATDALDEYMTTLMYRFSPGALKPTTAIIPYASLAAIAFDDVIYCAFGSYSFNESLANWVAPRSGMLQSFQIDVSTNNLTGSTEFIIRNASGIGAFANSSLVINVPGGTTGSFNVTGNVPINAGDRVSMRVTTPTVGGGAISFTGGVEFD